MAKRSQGNKQVFFKLISIFCCIKAVYSEDANDYQADGQYKDFSLSASHVRFAHLRCLQQFPLADTVEFKNTSDTHCYLHCYLFKLGLIDLNTRGLDNRKILDILDDIENNSFENCVSQYDFGEALTGKCSDSYKKLMDIRSNCGEFFEYLLDVNSTMKSEDLPHSKLLGQSASEYCDTFDDEHDAVMENSQSLEVTFQQHYIMRLICLYENFHYLDGYGRVDEAEINLSYQEVHLDSAATRSAIKICARRANAKFRRDYLGDLVFELQKCLKSLSPEFTKVSQRRDELSRDY